MTSSGEKNPHSDELVISRDAPKGVVVESTTADVDFSTISTTEPSPQNHGGILPDGSVISAITDHASIGGAVNPPSLNSAGHAMSFADTAVPDQVILDGEPSDAHHSNGIVSTETSHIPSADRQIPVETPDNAHPVSNNVATDSQSIQSMAASPDPTQEGAAQTQPISVSGDSLIASPPTQQKVQAVSALMDQDSGDTLDDYIRSPAVQNAIVERSPGGRYVRFMEKLGSGASKDVYRAYDTQEGIEVAWNVVTLSGVPKTERNRIVNEVRLLERLHHANIISFHGSWVNRERQEVNFVTEILSSGTLKSFIDKVQVIRWKIAKRWAVQILNGLEYLHSQDPPVIHRDLKCDNIFINGTSGDLRIGDLGLSTVHRNGRKLSVLGTPEFMAPDMYDDRPYDEKVDIYAFGMCMLEIFTKEIPYSECNNPAQIYKKVSAGEPPEILSRLQSRHAREFVEYCMGFKDENGIFVRPSAAELLKHPFLMKRANDDDEVVVEKPLRERTIAETPENANGSSIPRRKHESGKVSTSSSQPLQHVPSQGTNGLSNPSSGHPSGRQQQESSCDDDVDGNDHFDEMPESETNMKKVKVLMGRDQVLHEDDDDQHAPSSATSVDQNVPVPSVYAAQHETVLPPVQASDGAHAEIPDSSTVSAGPPSHTSAPSGPDVGTSQGDDNKQRHYLVAAAVIEHEGPDVRPYADDILKLVVTLPVEGQTQNVQFEFHLVEDDAVQVAKEMVQELDIPQDAVLEISETISGLACAARMKQDKYSARMKSKDEQSITQPIGSSIGSTNDPENGTTSVGSVAPNAADNLALTQNSSLLSQDGPSNSRTDGNVSQSIPDRQLPVVAPSPNPVSRHPSQPQNEQSSVTAETPAMSNPSAVNTQHAAFNNAQKVFQLTVSDASTEVVNQAPSSQAPSYQGTSDGQMSQAQHSQLHSLPDTGGHPQGVPSNVEGSVDHRSIPTKSAADIPHSRLQPQGHSGSLSDSREFQTQTFPDNVVDSIAPSTTAGSQGSNRQTPGQAPANVSSSSSNTTHVEAPSTPVPSSYALPPRPPSSLVGENEASVQGDVLSTDLDAMSPASRKEEASLVSGDEMNDEVREQLRKLEEDYQKNLKIAKKVFDSRMENLERSQTEKEAQHQKFLEKHEKERAAFEKRRALEEEQQMKRIELLQKEWDKKREMLAQQMNAPNSAESEIEENIPMELGGSASLTSLSAPDQLEQTSIPTVGSSQRNMSVTSSSSAVPPDSLQQQQQEQQQQQQQTQ